MLPPLRSNGVDPTVEADQISPSESASSRETDPVHGKRAVEKEREGENECVEVSVVRKISSSDRVTLRDIVRERVEVMAERMQNLPDEYLEEMKSELRSVLDGTGGAQQREEFFELQKLVQSRGDLTGKTMMGCHRSQLEILVAVKTGIQAFLHPSVSLSQSSLVEVFGHRRCRNIACQSVIPADECACDVCANSRGFCNLCMCVVCSRFDFEVNTCRWIGCDACSHWTHTDCAIREGLVGAMSGEAALRCRACGRTSELMGWVRDVFSHCAAGWDREALVRELDYASRIFRGSDDSRARRLFWKCEEMLEKLRSGVVTEQAARSVAALLFDGGGGADDGVGGIGAVAPREACERIAEVVREAVRKMEMVAEEKMRACKKARGALDACERELDDKAREMSELKAERLRKKQQVDELEKIVRLKHAEAEMFQLKANEARREAERLQRIAHVNGDKSEEEYATRYLKLRLHEAEAEKQYLFEKIKLQESTRCGGAGGGVSSPAAVPASDVLSFCTDMLNNVYPPHPKSQHRDLH